MSRHARNVRTAAAIYAFSLLLLLGVRFAPLMANRDDFVRYYFGGYVGFVQIRGGESATRLQDRIEGSVSSLPSTHDKLRFLAGRTPYVPLFVATTPLGMRAYEQTSSVHPGTWILSYHTLLWAMGIAASALFVQRTPAVASASWFLAAGVLVAWLNPHTSPFVPVPRGVTTLAAGLALACYLGGTASRPVLFLLALAPLFHPYQQLANVGMIFLFLLLVWTDGPIELLRRRSTWTMGAVAVTAACAGIVLVWLANGGRSPEFGSMLDRRSGFDLWSNWSGNREAFENSLKSVGIPLVALVWIEKGFPRSLRCAALFAGGLVLVAFLGQSGGFYPGEYVHRWAAMWTVVLFALLLRRDLFRVLSRSIDGRSLRIAGGIALSCLLFLYLSIDAWDPAGAWRRFAPPSTKEWGPVETECFRLLGSGADDARQIPDGAPGDGRGLLARETHRIHP
jgi:hypothetical protein